MPASTNSHKLFKGLKTSEVFNKISRPVIIADDIRTPENMGAIIRLGANIGASLVIFISDKATEFKSYKIHKTASGAAEKTAWEIVADFNAATKLLPKDYELTAIETSSKSENIFTGRLAEKIAFVVGNEVKGIRPEILEQINKHYYIPIPGPISSLNVTHALSVALFEWLRQRS
jgi:tRNA G18 (ribose-2'-O)-methylase SpoU